MATVNFLYRSTKDKAPLEVRLQHLNFLWIGKSQIVVSKYFWTKDRNKKSRDTVTINEQKRVRDLCEKLEEFVLEEFKQSNPDPTQKDWLKTTLLYFYNPQLIPVVKSLSNELLTFFDFYINVEKKRASKGMIYSYEALFNKLELFQAYKGKTIFVKDVNFLFMNEWFDWSEEQKYTAGTMQKDFSLIKTICYHARKKGIEVSKELSSDLKPSNHERKKADIESVYLNVDEIEQIQKADIPSELEGVRDWLIISCFTGQRISDFMRFNSNMVRTEAGRKIIEFTQQKTNKKMTVLLHGKVLEILDKRGGEFPEPIFYITYNQLLKTLCEIAKINTPTFGSSMIRLENGKCRKVKKTFPKWQLVTSHTGRRSYATNFYGVIPTIYLMAVTGHTTEAMFLSYIRKDNSVLALELAKYY
jgi:integrase